MDAYVDALAAFRDLINASPIVGKGKPLAGGIVTDQRPRSPGQGAIGFTTWVATPNEDADGLSSAVLSTLVLGLTDDNARKAAIALANFLRGFDGDPMPVSTQDATLLCVEQLTGPSVAPGNEYAYLLDALINFTPS